MYEQETPARGLHTITHRPLARRPDAPIPRVRIGGLDKPVSRLVQGCDANMTMPHTAVILDEYFACGGNVFDTSHYYGVPVGVRERNLGQWIRNRCVRDEVVVIEKGGNPPHGTPEGITAELNEGLERLQMDSVDIWLMHRDNPEVPRRPRDCIGLPVRSERRPPRADAGVSGKEGCRRSRHRAALGPAATVPHVPIVRGAAAARVVDRAPHVRVRIDRRRALLARAWPVWGYDGVTRM